MIKKDFQEKDPGAIASLLGIDLFSAFVECSVSLNFVVVQKMTGLELENDTLYLFFYKKKGRSQEKRN